MLDSAISWIKWIDWGPQVIELFVTHFLSLFLCFSFRLQWGRVPCIPLSRPGLAAGAPGRCRVGLPWVRGEPACRPRLQRDIPGRAGQAGGDCPLVSSPSSPGCFPHAARWSACVPHAGCWWCSITRHHHMVPALRNRSAVMPSANGELGRRQKLFRARLCF